MDKLKKVLNVIDGKGYKAYKDIQGGPFANPSTSRLGGHIPIYRKASRRLSPSKKARGCCFN